MKLGTRIGLIGVALLLVGVVTMLFPTADTRFVQWGGFIEVAGFAMIIVAAFRSTLKWLFMLLLVAPIYFLWLLAHGT